MATFRELYEIELKKGAPPTYGEAFLEKIAKGTMTSKAAVRSWLSQSRTPNKLTQKTIANLLKARPEDLFPPTKNNNNETN